MSAMMKPTVSSLLPEELPPVYAMQVDGQCFEPLVMHGTKLMFSRDEPYRPGDLVCLFFRPELVQPGEHQFKVKKLVFGPPPRFWIDPACNAGSNIQPVVIVEMLNPRKTLYLNPAALLGMHKCLGPVPATTDTFLVTEDEARALGRGAGAAS